MRRMHCFWTGVRCTVESQAGFTRVCIDIAEMPLDTIYGAEKHVSVFDCTFSKITFNP
jgi:hypothetical protein